MSCLLFIHRPHKLTKVFLIDVEGEIPFTDPKCTKIKHKIKLPHILGAHFGQFPSVSPVINRSDRNPPITATSVTFRPSLRHASGL